MHNQTPVYIFVCLLGCLFVCLFVFCFVFSFSSFFNSLFIQPLDLEDRITNKRLHLPCSPFGVGLGLYHFHVLPLCSESS